MEIRVSSGGNHLDPAEKDRIEKDLEKIARRLGDLKEVIADVRITSNSQGSRAFNATLEVARGRKRFIAKAESPDVGQAVRAAREEIMRQINDQSRRGHSSFTKGR